MTPPTTKSFLRNWTLTIPPEDHRQPRMVSALRRLEETLGQVQGRMPSIQDAKESMREVEEGWQRGLAIASLPKRHLRRFAWALFQPWAREGLDLPAHGPFVEAYRNWLTKNRSGAKAARLIHPYLRYFPGDVAFREDWRRFLADVVEQHPGRRLAVWKERHGRFGLLGHAGAEEFARLIMKEPDQYDDLLEQAGLTGFLADSRFVRVAVRSLILQISQELQSNSDLSRTECESLLAVLESSPGTFRFEEFRVEIAETLLSPWMERTPPKPVKQAIWAFCHRHFGNPIIDSGGWSGISERPKQVFVRWLAERALDTFFDILDRTALDRQWQQRKAFWDAYLKEGMISEAWLALGTAAGLLADRVIESSEGSWAALQGAQPNQSVLLMKIRNVTIVEWSHQGAARMWLDGHPKTPKLYDRYYTAYRLRASCDIRIIHRPNLEWRGTTARWIEKQTGLNPRRSRIR